MALSQNRILLWVRQAEADGWYTAPEHASKREAALEWFLPNMDVPFLMDEIQDAVATALDPTLSLDFLNATLDILVLCLIADDNNIVAVLLLNVIAEQLCDRSETSSYQYSVLLSALSRQLLQELAVPPDDAQEMLITSLRLEVLARSHLVALGYIDSENVQEIASLCMEARDLLDSQDSRIGELCLYEGDARKLLAALGNDAVASLAESLRLYKRAQSAADHSISLAAYLGEASARVLNATLGKRSDENLRTALALLTEIRNSSQMTPLQASLAAGTEANVRFLMFVLQGQRLDDLLQADICCRSALASVEVNSPLYFSYALLSCSIGRALVETGRTGVESLVEITTIARAARNHPDICLSDKVTAHLEECYGYLLLAEHGHNVEEYVHAAEELTREAIRLAPQKGAQYAYVADASASALLALSVAGVDSVHNAQKALEYFEAVVDSGQVPDQAVSRALIQMSQAHLWLGEAGLSPAEHYRSAQTLCQRARLLLDASHPIYCTARVQEAAAILLLMALGLGSDADLAACQVHIEYALENLDPNSLSFGRALRYAGILHLSLAHARPESVREHLEQAVQFCRDCRGRFEQQSPDYVLATNCELQAQLQIARSGEAAASHVDQAAELASELAQLPASTPSLRAIVQLGAGDIGLARARRDVDAAPEVPAEAKELRELLACLPASGMLAFRSHFQLAISLAESGRDDEAFESLTAAFDILDRIRGELLTEEERIDYHKDVVENYSLMVDACITFYEQATLAENAHSWRWRAWHWVHRSKGRALADALAGERPQLGRRERELLEDLNVLAGPLEVCERQLQKLGAPLLAHSFEEWTKEHLHEFATLLASDGRLDELQHYEYLKGLYIDKRRALRQRCTHLQSAAPVDSPEEILRHLQLLDRGHGVDACSDRTLFIEFFEVSAGDLAVFLMPLWEEGPPVIQRIVLPEHGLHTLMRRYVACTTVAEGSPDKAPKRDWDALLTLIGQYLIVPWQDYLTDMAPDTLVFAPHKMLNLLPLHAAFWQGQPLIERFAVAYLPSAGLAKPLAQIKRPVSNNVMLVGDPHVPWALDLPLSKRELRWLAEIVNDAGLRSRQFTGPEATTEAVLQFACQASVLHFACHSVTRWDDFLRSGLELTDRRLTVLDIGTGVGLPCAKLAYLNSCNSAETVLSDGDEMFALIRGFLYAGCPTVIAGLWEVRDDVGEEFARHFYQRWLVRREPMLQAFHRAQSRIRLRYNNPLFWAGFVLVGAWRG